MWAAKEGHLSVVQHLHSVGADIESKDQVGLFVFSMYTVCMYVCMCVYKCIRQLSDSDSFILVMMVHKCS